MFWAKIRQTLGGRGTSSYMLNPKDKEKLYKDHEIENVLIVEWSEKLYSLHTSTVSENKNHTNMYIGYLLKKYKNMNI